MTRDNQVGQSIVRVETQAVVDAIRFSFTLLLFVHIKESYRLLASLMGTTEICSDSSSSSSGPPSWPELESEALLPSYELEFGQLSESCV